MAEVVFWILWVVAVISAGIVAFSRNLIYAVFSLLATLVSVAGIYIYLNADFLAVTQIMLYVGGILVLLVFGVMLTHRITSARISQSSFQQLLGGLAVLLLIAVLLVPILSYSWPTGSGTAFTSTVGGIGKRLFSDYLILFEVASVLLLGALIGAATLARKDL